MTTLAVTLISVAGTLGGTLGGSVLSQRAGRAEAVAQNQRADREREQQRSEQALRDKRDLYARLNTTARAYRIAARDTVLAMERGENVDPAVLDAAKEAWGEQYSQAQMALTRDVLEVASELNKALGVGYSVVKLLPGSPGGPASHEAYKRARIWFGGPLSDGVYLLRVTLRHDLGVEADPRFERTRAEMLTALGTARRNLEHLLTTERGRAAG